MVRLKIRRISYRQARRIIEHSEDADGKIEKYNLLSSSHGASAQRQDSNPIPIRIGRLLEKAGIY
jgi:hypothetical protein